MVREFMKSHTEKDFVIITGVDNNKFYDRLKQETGFEKDKRIKFVGTVYDSELLKKYGKMHLHTSMDTKWEEQIQAFWKLWGVRI